MAVAHSHFYVEGPIGVESKISDGLTVQHQLAPTSRRIIAYAVDIGLCMIPIYLAFVLLGIVFATSSLWVSKKDLMDPYVAGGLLALLFLVAIGLMSIFHAYFIYNEYKTGTTLGKRLLGLKVISATGARVTLKQCILRDMARYIDCTLLFPGILTISLTKQRQRLGDLMAHTLVTYSPLQDKKSTFLYVGQHDFILHSEKIKTLNFAPATEKQFLRFSFNRFINRKSSSDLLQQEKSWIDMIKKDTPNAVNYNPEMLLRLVAESIHQRKVLR